MQQPLAIARFVQLSTDKALERPAMLAWYQCVQRHAPSGVVIGVPTSDPHGRPTTVQLVHRRCDDRECYLVPVSRDLGVGEVDVIVEAFAAMQPDLDFEVETNDTKLIAQDYGEIPLDAAQHVALCLALAKHQHEDWVRERTDAGWRYGVVFDAQHKTHPLIRPWDQVPDRFKNPNMGLPQTLLTLLNSHGYSVLARDDLDRLLQAAKGDLEDSVISG
jgi:hypothetical protein